MITNFKNTSISEELTIMAMADIDEDHAYKTWKYDRMPDFACKCYVTPAELEEYRHLQQVIAFGWTLFDRLLTEVEEQEDFDMRMMGHYHYEDLRVA